MDEEKWVIEEINKQLTLVSSYEEKALWLSLIRLMEEQEHRIKSLEGELDGTMWSKTKW